MRYGAKQSYEEQAGGEYQHISPEVARRQSSNYRSQRRSQETLRGNRKCRTERRLSDHKSCNRRPVGLRQPK
jgi:hypothetical protein